MAGRINGVREQTYGDRIEKALADEMLTAAEIAKRAAVTFDHVWNHLHCLMRKYQAANYEMEGGKRHWYLTPATDKRKWHAEAAIPQGPGYRGGVTPRRNKAATDAAIANEIAERLKARKATG